jgi:hypothetical protein
MAFRRKLSTSISLSDQHNNEEKLFLTEKIIYKRLWVRNSTAKDFFNKMTSIPKDGVTFSTQERLAELRLNLPKLLKGYSKIYITKKLDKKFPFKQSGIVCLRPGLFGQVRQRKSNSFIPILESSDVLTFIPRREITQIVKTRPSTAKKNLRRYILVLFNPPKNEIQRRTFSRIVHRTPLIRIRPGVILLPQIRTKRVRHYTPSLLRPSEFIAQISELDTPVWYAPRLELVGASSDKIISQFVHSHLEKRAQRIVESCRSLFYEIKRTHNLGQSTKLFRRPFRHLQSKLHLIRKQAQFFQNEFDIDITHLVNRVASAVSRVHHKLKICDN